MHGQQNVKKKKQELLLNITYIKSYFKRLAYSFELSSHRYLPQKESPFQQTGCTITALLEGNY